ncbi:MAG: YeeE/YedE family protein [Methylotenera sp.]|nr:YeeE/YedE family protein [Methylotenera sp.]
MIDWTNFTPWSALCGGILIGLAASLLILLNGKIAGISGILGGLLQAKKHDIAWRIMFILGLIASPMIWQAFAHLPAMSIDADNHLLAIAGVLVGVGTRYAAGCTSGHGVCGISRLSLRSIIATLLFMVTGFITVYLMRHGLGV